MGTETRAELSRVKFLRKRCVLRKNLIREISDLVSVPVTGVYRPVFARLSARNNFQKIGHSGRFSGASRRKSLFFRDCYPQLRVQK